MSDCLFCKIAKKEIPAHVIYEDGTTIAFLDINPSAPGHTVVIPKEHYSSIQELPPESVAAVFVTAKTVVNKLEKAVGSGHFTIGFNNGRLSGQEIDHLHVHVIPRYENDGGGSVQSVVKNSSQEGPEEIKSKILKANG
jgi:histidine triad (HIT) family protein